MCFLAGTVVLFVSIFGVDQDPRSAPGPIRVHGGVITPLVIYRGLGSKN
jgi:hypothetical protein